MTIAALWRQTGNARDRSGISIELFLVLVFVTISALSGAALCWLYQESLEASQARAGALAHVLTEHLGRTVASLDAAMVQLALHSQRVGGPHAATDAWMPALTAARAELPGIGSINVLDAKGVITQSTVPGIVGQSRAGRFLTQGVLGNGSGLIADTPFLSPASGQYVLPFGRALVGADGQLTGLLAVTLDPEQLRTLYRSLDIGPSGLISVLHPRGLVLFREPSSVNPTGETAGKNRILLAARAQPKAGFVSGTLAPGGVTYLSAYRQLDAPPLIVAVSLAERDALGEWRNAAWVTIGVLSAVGLVLGFAGWQLGREMRARISTEAELADKVRLLEDTASQRDAASVALSKSQARFQAIMEQAPVSVFVKDLEGRFTFASRASANWSGIPAADILGRKASDVLTGPDAAYHEEYDREVTEKRTPIQRELTTTLPSGKRVGLYNKFPIFDAGGEISGIGTIIVDVTAQKQLEAQLMQSQKMEAVGQLTGGIAHDFNNLLTAILLNSDILTSRLDPTDKLQPLAQVILEAAERGAELTKRLLAFSRRQMLEARPTDINGLVIGMESLMQRSLGEDISIALVLTGDLRAARVDANQLESAILNLALNARDAMPNGGRLLIETANVALDETYAASNAEVTPGPYVMVAVTDSGTGMPPEVAARAFEPFFTTKGVGKGTGLGLSMIYGFVKQSGGHVKIYSESGVGTCIKLYLPPADVEADAPARRAADTPLPGGSETVLLVEDDRLVRKNTEAQLAALGYAVITAEAASEALQKVEAGLVPDLLFTDVVMPGGINGFELARKMRARLPQLQVLFSSGYTHGAATQPDGNPETARHFLGKPFRRRDLAAKVREALDDSLA